tara:strand:- start:123 stop:1148 length:1026 start_codon:yes stop_codon:yes gene_type:complete
MSENFDLIRAQADLHQQYFVGLQLMVSARDGPEAMRDWLYRLFRQQHEEKFLSSFEKLGLDGLPDAVASAQYHVLSNTLGGVGVEYMPESDTKAWVRYRYPRWWLDGAALCGIPAEAGDGFMRGWHANNGASLGNPRLGFVCVSQDMTGEFGFCGYFKEFDRDLSEKERLQYAPDERPPPYDASVQPSPPAAQWDEARLAKAYRNYAVEFVRNGVSALVATLGRAQALDRACLAARLTGLQQYMHLASSVGAVDGGAEEAGRFLKAMFEGMGDEVEIDFEEDRAILRHMGLRVVRGIEGDDRSDLLRCWIEIWKGAVASHRAFLRVTVDEQGERLIWSISQ